MTGASTRTATPCPASRAVAILDVGKTHTRIVVALPDGQVLAERRRQSQSLEEGPYPHLDAEGTWAWLLDALADLSATCPPIGTIVPVTHGAAVACLADDGLAMPVLDYEHAGPETLGDAYHAPPFTATRSPALPRGLNLGRQLVFLEQTFPAAFARVTRLLPYPQYFAWRLSGVAATEVTSLGCHTDLWLPASGEFSSLAKSRGYASRFPAIRRAGEVLGTVTREIATLARLTPSCEVRVGGHDSSLAHAYHRATFAEPTAVVSTGTWILCMAPSTPLEQLDEARDMLALVDPDGRPVPAARFMGGREYAAIATPAGLALAPERERLDRCLRPGGPMAWPAFADEGGPFRRHRGWIETSHPVEIADRPLLAALYTALMTDLSLEALGHRGPCVVEGRFAANEGYLGLLAALRHPWPVFASDATEGIVYGALALTEETPRRYGAPARRIDPWSHAGLPAYRERFRAGVRELRPPPRAT